MFMFFKYCTYHVCQLLYYSMVCILYIHGTDMSVHVYARWSGFQMMRPFLLMFNGSRGLCQCHGLVTHGDTHWHCKCQCGLSHTCQALSQGRSRRRAAVGPRPPRLRAGNRGPVMGRRAPV